MQRLSSAFESRSTIEPPPGTYIAAARPFHLLPLLLLLLLSLLLLAASLLLLLLPSLFAHASRLIDGAIAAILVALLLLLYALLLLLYALLLLLYYMALVYGSGFCVVVLFC